MRNPRVIVEIRKRGLFRRNPEQLMIDAEGRAEHVASVKAAEQIPEEQALRSALAAFAAVVGWPEARCWLAARAHEKPKGGAKDAIKPAIAAGHALFERRAG